MASPPLTATGLEASELGLTLLQSLLEMFIQELSDFSACAPGISHKTEALENRQGSPGFISSQGSPPTFPIPKSSCFASQNIPCLKRKS